MKLIVWKLFHLSEWLSGLWRYRYGQCLDCGGPLERDGRCGGEHDPD